MADKSSTEINPGTSPIGNMAVDGARTSSAPLRPITFNEPMNLGHIPRPDASSLSGNNAGTLSYSGGLNLPPATKPVATDYTMAMRTPLTKPILEGLLNIGARSGTHSSIKSAADTFKAMRTFLGKCSADPLYHVISALYDAMVYKDGFLQYSRDHYQKAYDLLHELARNSKLSHALAMKAVSRLDAIGFNTLPIEFDSWEDSEEEDYADRRAETSESEEAPGTKC